MSELTAAGLYDFVSTDFIVAGAKMRLNIRDHTLDDIYLKDLVIEALKELRNLGTQVQAITQLEIDADFKAKLPDGFLGFVKNWPIVYVNAEGLCVNGTGQVSTETITDGSGNVLLTQTLPSLAAWTGMCGPVFTNNAFFKNSPYGQGFSLYGTAQVEKGYLWFSSNVTAQFVKISYNSVNIDENTGKLLIPGYCARALTAYACWKWSVTNEKPLWIQIWGPEWRAGKAQSRAIPAMPDSFQYELINRVMHTLI